MTVLYSDRRNRQVYRLPAYCSFGEHLILDVDGAPMGGRWECSEDHFARFAGLYETESEVDVCK